MFIINKSKLEDKSKERDCKNDLGNTDNNLYEIYKLNLWNLFDFTNSFSKYEMAQWCLHINRWMKNRLYEHTRYYKRGSIVLVELGGDNFKFEPSFAHPCIILAERERKILIVPCSSKRYGRGFRDIIDAKKNIDGFQLDTGIQVEDYRWVNKNRIISKLGKTSPDILNKIDKRILKDIPSYRKEKAKYAIIENKNSELEEEIIELKNKNSELEEEIIELKNKINKRRKKTIKK